MHPRSVCSPWQQWSTFGALSGYLIKTSSLCVRAPGWVRACMCARLAWTWTFLLSPKLLSEDDTPAEKCRRRGRGCEGRSWGETEDLGGVRSPVRSPWWCRCIDQAVAWSPSANLFTDDRCCCCCWNAFFFWGGGNRAAGGINRNILASDFQST